MVRGMLDVFDMLMHDHYKKEYIDMGWNWYAYASWMCV